MNLQSINRNSDFKIVEDYGTGMLPTELTFWTNNRRVTVSPGDDCVRIETSGTGTKYVISFNAASFECGRMRVERRYRATDSDMPDGTFDRCETQWLDIWVTDGTSSYNVAATTFYMPVMRGESGEMSEEEKTRIIEASIERAREYDEKMAQSVLEEMGASFEQAKAEAAEEAQRRIDAKADVMLTAAALAAEEAGARAKEEALAAAYAKMAELQMQLSVIGLSLRDDIVGCIKISGTDDPRLTYKTFKIADAAKNPLKCLHPCLVAADTGRIFKILQKTNIYKDIDGNDVAEEHWKTDYNLMICSTREYYQIAGVVKSGTQSYDVYLLSYEPFNLFGRDAERVGKWGVSPDVAKYIDGVGYRSMALNLKNDAWPDELEAIPYEGGDTPNILLHGEGIEQMGPYGGLYQCNIVTASAGDMSKEPQYPFRLETAKSVERWFAMLMAEGGRYDFNKITEREFNEGKMSVDGFGTGFEPSGVPTIKHTNTAAEVTDMGAFNGPINRSASLLLVIGENVYEYGLSEEVREFKIQGLKMIDSLRNYNRSTPFMPFTMNEILAWESYKRDTNEPEAGESPLGTALASQYVIYGVDGYEGLKEGEFTGYIRIMRPIPIDSSALDFVNGEVQCAFLVYSCGIYKGITITRSPRKWVSGLRFRVNGEGDYECWVQRDDSRIEACPEAYDASGDYDFTTNGWELACVLKNGDGYRTGVNDKCLLLPPDDAHKSGGTGETYVCAHNRMTGQSDGEGLYKAFTACLGGAADDAAKESLSMDGTLYRQAEGVYVGLSVDIQD